MGNEGTKHDAGKPPMGLIDRYAAERLAEVLAFGAKKYGRDNWRGGFKYSRLYDAALRHIFAFIDGEDFDPESNLPHLAHAMCMVMFLLRMTSERPDLDDRYLRGAAEAQGRTEESKVRWAEAQVKAMRDGDYIDRAFDIDRRGI